jgi:hypothetical protein
MTNRRLSLLLAAMFALPVAGCANRYKVDTEPPTYAGKAKIRVKTNRDDNREMTMTVEHLAPPSRIDPTYKGYAVWIKVPGHAITKAGVLDYNSRRRRGTLTATTPHPKFEVLVSLETDLSAPAPSPHVILSKLVARA